MTEHSDAIPDDLPACQEVLRGVQDPSVAALVS
jgi:hypothetical protein